ncbi:MAG: NAD-dependent epimerase/dehydratase family protein, partial [Clostridia bacterium]|nr:NAD-dependent epimerase/dehydratase family protein [Clostridia bacterium]
KMDIFKGDISNKENLKNTFIEFKPDIIFHLAGYGVQVAENNIDKAIETNIIGTTNVIRLAKDIGCKRIVNIGTCAEYGDSKETLSENTCVHPINIYGSSKAAATIIGHQIAKENEIDMITLRLFGVFGESEPRHKIFCNTILTLLEEKDMMLTSCTQYRDYCYVGDIVRAMIMAVENTEVKNEIFNVGTGNGSPLRYYLERIHKILGSSQKLLFGHIENRKNELWFPNPDISKIKTMLGWEPIFKLDDSIEKTISWYAENKHYYMGLH